MGGRKYRAAQAVGVAALLALAAASAALAAEAHRGPAHRLSLHAQRLETRAQRAVLDLYSLDTRLHAANGNLYALESLAADLRSRRHALRHELAGARSTLQVSRRALALRLRALYEEGNVDPVAVLLGSTSLGNGLARLDDLKRVTDESKQVVAVTVTARRRLLRARRTLSVDARRLTRSLTAARAAQQALEAAAQARASYLASLHRTQLATTQVSSIVRSAGTAAQKTQRLQGRQTPVAGGRKLTVSATCYDLPGHTATGMPVGWGVVAVDPTVIPLGTKLYVPGYGKGVAADVGGGIKGDIIDLWMPYSSCAKWGRRTVTITVY